ncbi:MAG: septum formation initiator family protein [Propionibacteriaceae bacterium]|nr:septum formation initiator family protein [Propionibacteriaceae bacterium]
MAQSPRLSNSGPGRGTPRSRTSARPGERNRKPAVEPLPEQEVDRALSSKPAPPPRASRAVTATWRLVVLLAVVAGLGLVLANSLRVYFAQAAEIAAVRAEIVAEQDRIAEMQDQLARWDDPEYVRSVARVRLGWVMPGEIGYRVIDAEGNPLEGVTMEEPEPELTGEWYEKMWTSVKLADTPAEKE